MAGGMMMALAVPVAFIMYIVTLSPFAPAKYYKRVAGIGDSTSQLGLVLLILVAVLLLGGGALYLAGWRKGQRAKR